MIFTLTAILFATINAIVSGYYFVQAIKTPVGDESRPGSFIFAGLSSGTTFFLFYVAATHHELT